MEFEGWDSSAQELVLDVSPVFPDTRCLVVFDYFQRSPTIPGVAVTNAEGKVVGLISRLKCLTILARQFMLDLYSKRPVSLIMDANPPFVLSSDNLDEVTFKLSSAHGKETVDGFVIVDEETYYVGIGRIADLLAKSAEQNRLRADVYHRARLEAESASQTRGAFLANMSHEIRTPMNAIIGMSTLALRLDIPPKARSYLEKIQGASNALLGIINDVLDFSKIDSGQLTIESVDFELSKLLHDVASALELQASMKGLEFLLSLDPRLPHWVRGDPLRVRQILLNFCSNAIKFTLSGEVVVSVVPDEASDGEVGVKFDVRDTGIGLTQEQIGRLFQSFSQADSSTTRRFGGTGLGLAISKQLTELMGGQIGVVSVPGAGSTFWFSIPFKASDQTPHHVEECQTDLSDLKVLVADDNASARTIIAEYLMALGMTVDQVSSGYEAISAIENATPPFDMVLLDWWMPGMDGIKTIETLHQKHELVKLPKIIMVSAYDRDDIIAQSEALGVSAFLIKPFNQKSLAETIATALINHENNESSSPLTVSIMGTPQWQGQRILLVEDNLFNQELASELLTQAGFHVTLAENGQEAIETITLHSFDCVLMDIQMPVMDGYTATVTIRKNPTFQKLPIIAMTADAMDEDRTRAMASGMNDFISKPIVIEKLFSTLKKWLPPDKGDL